MTRDQIINGLSDAGQWLQRAAEEAMAEMRETDNARAIGEMQQVIEELNTHALTLAMAVRFLLASTERRPSIMDTTAAQGRMQ